MKIADGYNKLRGGYYTPKKIADFLSNWAIRSKDDNVLEPSCGDGSFLESIVEKLSEIECEADLIRQQVLGVELDTIEANKALNSGANVKNADFFKVYKEELLDRRKFTVVLGNPPFIRYQNVDKEIRDDAFALLKEFGFKPNKMTNIWMPFLNLSCQLLEEDGRLGMVIPAELFQVDYAAESRQFLVDYFEQLTIITFKELVFDGIQQEVILLLGDKKSEKKGIRVIELENLDCLDTLAIDDIEELKELDHTTEKWTKYYLTNFEIDLIRRLNRSENITDVTELFKINVGLVSGENDFFVINQSTVDEYNLHHSYNPILSRSEQTKGISLTAEDFFDLQKKDKRVYLFTPYKKDDPEILAFEKEVY